MKIGNKNDFNDGEIRAICQAIDDLDGRNIIKFLDMDTLLNEIERRFNKTHTDAYKAVNTDGAQDAYTLFMKDESWHILNQIGELRMRLQNFKEVEEDGL